MKIEAQDVFKVKDFVKSLNLAHDSIIVVEGKRDEDALKKLGYCGKICQFHRLQGISKICRQYAQVQEFDIITRF